MNYGGGVQTAAMCVLVLQGLLPKPDFIVVADTGREKGSTWDYLDQVTGPALRAQGMVVHRPKKGDYAFRHDDIWSNKGTLLIPAYTTENNRISKLPGYCSTWWKKEVVRNYLRREHGIKRRDQRNWIGFSINESLRFLRMKRSKDYALGRLWMPLVEAVPLSREQCLEVVRKYGWPTPPRSSCWMCPNTSNAEWLEIKKNRPEEFEQACLLDEKIRERDPHAWLHSSGTPLRTADLTPKNKGATCAEGGCFL